MTSETTNNMKPFNLELAKNGSPLQTRSGLKVTEFRYSEEAAQDQFCITALVHYDYGKEYETFKINGAFSPVEISKEFDLFMAEPEAWINVYYSKIQDKIWNSVKYNSEKEAKENIVTTNSSYLTTVQIP